MMVPQTPTMYLAPQYSYPPVSVKLHIYILSVEKVCHLFLLITVLALDFQTLLIKCSFLFLFGEKEGLVESTKRLKSCHF